MIALPQRASSDTHPCPPTAKTWGLARSASSYAAAGGCSPSMVIWAATARSCVEMVESVARSASFVIPSAQMSWKELNESPAPWGYLVDHDGLRRAQLPPRGAVRKAGYNTGIRPPGPLATRNLDLG